MCPELWPLSSNLYVLRPKQKLPVQIWLLNQVIISDGHLHVNTMSMYMYNIL